MSIDAVASLPMLGGYGIVGFAAGFVVRKLLKYLLILVGIYVASLVYLQQVGWITINGGSDRLVGAFLGFIEKEGGRLWAVASQSLPTFGAFGLGLCLGFARA